MGSYRCFDLFSLFTRATPGLCACVKVKSPPSDVSAVHAVSSTCRQAPALTTRKKFHVRNNYILPINELAKQKIKETRKKIEAN